MNQGEKNFPIREHREENKEDIHKDVSESRLRGSNREKASEMGIRAAAAAGRQAGGCESIKGSSSGVRVYGESS